MGFRPAGTIGTLIDSANLALKRENRGFGIITIKKEETKMNQTKFFITTIAITLLLGFTVTAVPLWAATKEEVKQEKADIPKWQMKRLLDYTK